MRLVRYGNPGEERPGLLAADGTVRSVASLIDDWSAIHLSPAALAVLSAIDPDRLPQVDGSPRLGPPIGDIRQIIAVGLNYRDHAAEAGMDVPEHPLVFHKGLGSLSGPDDPILLAQVSEALDWEAELAFVINRQCRHVPAASALDYVGGYVAAGDISERDWQFGMGGREGKGKSYDSYTPIGPWLLTADELPDPQTLTVRLDVNGTVRQNGNTAEMLFSVARLIEHISRFQTLLPGDLILTGTPAGVGFGMKPRTYLKADDVLTIEIAELGRQTHRIIQESEAAQRL